MDTSAIVDRLWAIEQIKAVTVRYGRALDSRDWALLRTCFTSDAVGDFGPWGTANGVEEIVGAAAPVMEGMDQTQHVMSDHTIEFAPDLQSAGSVCNLVAEHLLVTHEGSSTSTTRGIYVDQWVKVADEWKISHRQLKVTWREGNTGIFGIAFERSSALDNS